MPPVIPSLAMHCQRKYAIVNIVDEGPAPVLLCMTSAYPDIFFWMVFTAFNYRSARVLSYLATQKHMRQHDACVPWFCTQNSNFFTQCSIGQMSHGHKPVALYESGSKKSWKISVRWNYAIGDFWNCGFLFCYLLHFSRELIVSRGVKLNSRLQWRRVMLRSFFAIIVMRYAVVRHNNY